MSYCRTSEPHSDVYIFGTQEGLECIIANEQAEKLELPTSFVAKHEDRATQKKIMLGHILWLEDQGLHVPPHAKRRLLYEIDHATNRLT